MTIQKSLFANVKSSLTISGLSLKNFYLCNNKCLSSITKLINFHLLHFISNKFL